MNAARLIEFYSKQRDRGAPLVLASVVDVGGSTYSKPGEFMLISGAGEFCGMLSGGCLESDLVERAAVVLTENKPQTAIFDLSQDDELWGLGVGCEGTMHIYLQPVLAETGYAPFAAIVDVLNGHVAASIPISSDHSILVAPTPALLVLGAGPDSEPLVNMALELGWRCTVCDHRPAYVDGREFGQAAEKVCIETSELSPRLAKSHFDMALVMSHHMVSDRSYLRQLAETEIQYIGLLGPPGRRDRLLDDLGEAAHRLRGRLRAPVGLQFGGRGAGSIAVEIIAQMQVFLVERR